MFAFLKRRAFWTILGLLLAAALILLFGPLLAFGTARPLESYLGRGIAIAALFAWYGLWTLLKRARANRAGNQLATAVVKQSEKERPSADVVQLRERFEEAIAALKQGKRRKNLYELPWYVIIGAPGSGKTTALVNSGLHFPLEQRSGKGALRGVGGTRNCDWWFTEEAVLLDTAGRYTTQDSDAAADSAGWAEFLTLLRTYRKRRPINGVLLAISAQDLIVQGQAGREAHVAAARRRLVELNKELRIQLPVYVLVTKCDLVSGFTEYFDDMNQEDRAQVWGVTFSREQTEKGAAAGAFGAEFDALVHRLNERVFARLEDEHDVRRRAKIFGFPQQMGALRENLEGFVSDVFEATRFDQKILLRGVYFTSGTQEGTPIDRLLGSLGRRFSVAPDAIAPAGGRGRAYFIQRFLKDVMLAESGLAGVNRRVEVQQAAVQLGTYAAMVLIAVGGFLLLWHSYSTNQKFLTEYRDHTANVAQTLPARAGSPIEVLPRLDRVRGLVDRAHAYTQDVSWVRRGWGLNQGPWVEESAADVYKSELNNASLLATRDPVMLYEYLRAYLMLEDPRRFDRAQVEKVANQEWRTAYGADPKNAERLSAHFSSLLAYDLPGIETDKTLVENVRNAIPPEAVSDLLYSQVKLEFTKKNLPPPPLESFFIGKVFRRPANAQLVPGMFTKAGFDAMSDVIDAADATFEREIWVWGESRPGLFPPAVRKQGVWKAYETEYIGSWDRFLNGIGIVTPTSREAAIEMVRAMSGTTSALKQLLKIVDTNTFLAKSLSEKKPEGILGTISSAISEWERWVQAWSETHSEEPGARVTTHFAAIHALLLEVGGAAPIDKLLERVKGVGAKLETMGGNTVGGNNDPAAVAGLSQASLELKREAGDLKGPVAGIGAMLADLGSSAERVSTGEMAKGLSERLNDAAKQCTAAIGGRYPFNRQSQEDVTIVDFQRMFAPGGVFDTFIKTDLAQVASVVGSDITWKTLPSGADAAGFSAGVRGQLEMALKIRDLFFTGSDLRAGYTIKIDDLDPSNKIKMVELAIDGKTITWKYESPRPIKLSWPGDPPTGAVVTFTEFAGGTPNIATPAGPWALFRLIGSGTLEPKSATLYRLRLGKDGDSVGMDLIADSVRNPFGGLKVLQGFNCAR
jgi:type VI secretion system protein ImpL